VPGAPARRRATPRRRPGGRRPHHRCHRRRLRPRAARRRSDHGRRLHGRARAVTGRPSAWITDHLALAPPGPALDVACGAGRPALLRARAGRGVDATDRDLARCRALAADAARERLSLRVLCADLEQLPLPRRRYAVVVNTLYLDRALVPRLVDALLPGGLLSSHTSP